MQFKENAGVLSADGKKVCKEESYRELAGILAARLIPTGCERRAHGALQH
jgi:hypothetical protein